VLYDVPVNINGYQPQNYDKGYNGAVTLRHSLAYSLNIPAVAVLNEVGIPAFSSTLRKGGFTHIKTKNLGLSLALGGCGVTLEELTNAYSALANYGHYKPLNYINRKKTNNSVEMVSEEAAYLTSDILATLVRPDIPSAFFNNTFRIPKVAWKTGTSYGRKDAWAIGYNKDYTVGIWVGNFDAEGVPSLSGAEIATPLLFEIFNTIDYNSNKKWFAAPKGIDYRYVCSKTGNLPAPFCTDKITDQFIGNKTLQKTCNHLIEIPVNKDSSFSYCNSCLPTQDYFTKLYPNLPATLINYYVQEKIVFKAIPKHNPNCTRIYQTNGPKIVSPSNGSEYLIETESNAQIMLNAEADNKASKILWYINDKLVKEALPNQAVFITPPIGIIKITCSDDLGRSSYINITTKKF
jgi:penicillin-binding protein 1C